MTGENMTVQLESMLTGLTRAVAVVHMHPDGDAMGSGIALVRYLSECRGMQATLVVPDAPPQTIDFISEGTGFIDASSDPSAAEAAISCADAVFCLDHNEFSRTAAVEPMLRSCCAPKVLIDHHLNPSAADFALVFSKTAVSSTCELLYWILKDLAGGYENLPLDILTPLMAGMTTDSNNFANSTYPSTLAMASELLDAGVDRENILLHLYGRYRENRFRAMGCYLGDLLKITPYGVAYAVLDAETAARLDIRDGETEGFVNLPLGIDGVNLSIFLREDDGYYRVSLRSRLGVSACRLARESFNGGGHEQASGGRLYFPGDIADKSLAAEYVEKVTARFMCR